MNDNDRLAHDCSSFRNILSPYNYYTEEYADRLYTDGIDNKHVGLLPIVDRRYIQRYAFLR